MAKVQYFIAKPHSVDLNWYLQDIDTGATFIATEEEVKDYVRRKRKNIINLTLDENGNLVKQNAFNFNAQAIEGIKNSPSALKIRGIAPLAVNYRDSFESSMDLLIKRGVEVLEDMTDHIVTGKVLDQDKNLFQLNIKVKDNKIFKDKYLMVLVRYEQMQYGQIANEDGTFLTGDIYLGVRAVRLPDGTVHNFETGSSPLSQFLFESKDDSFNEISNEMASERSYVAEFAGLNCRDLGLLEAFDIRKKDEERTWLTISTDPASIAQNKGSLFLLDSIDEVQYIGLGIQNCVSSLILKVCFNHGIEFNDLAGALALSNVNLDKAGKQLPEALSNASAAIREKGTRLVAKARSISLPKVNDLHFMMRCVVGGALVLLGTGAAVIDHFANILTKAQGLGAAGAIFAGATTLFVAATADPDSWASPIEYITCFFQVLGLCGDTGGHHHHHDHHDRPSGYHSHGTRTTTSLSSGSMGSSLGSSRGSSLSSGSSSRGGSLGTARSGLSSHPHSSGGHRF